MIGALIGAGLSAAGSIFGAVQGARAARKAKKQLLANQAQLQEQAKENRAWFARRYNEDPTQRADAQKVLNMVAENVKNRNKAAEGTKAVMGGTTESVAASRAANNKAISDTAGDIAANAAAQKDTIEQRYQARMDNINEGMRGIRNQLSGVETARAQNIASATGNLLKAGGNIASSIDAAQDAKADREERAKIMERILPVASAASAGVATQTQPTETVAAAPKSNPAVETGAEKSQWNPDWADDSNTFTASELGFTPPPPSEEELKIMANRKGVLRDYYDGYRF